MYQKGKRINEEIKVSKLNVISSNGEKLGVISIENALVLAEEAGMDLVEIGNQDGFVLAKIMDYGKFVFKQQKSIAKNKSTSKKAEIKTIRITYKIDKHDMEVKKNLAIKFAKEGKPLKVILILKGRENQYEKAGLEKINEFISLLEDIYKLEGNILKTGNSFNALLKTKK